MNMLTLIEQGLLLSNLTAGQPAAKQDPEKLAHTAIIGLTSLSYVLLLGGLSVYLYQNTSIPVMLTVLGMVVLVTSLLIVAGLRIISNIKKRRFNAMVNSALSDAEQFAARLGDDAEELFKNNAGSIALMTALAGFLAARKII